MIDEVNRFMRLFGGNPRSFGQWVPDTTKMSTEKATVTLKNYANHIDGKVGLGVVPIMDDGTCTWGAVDIDNHGQDDDLDLPGITKAIATKFLPLTACRSKSGGIHVYLFLREPVKASVVRAFLLKWAATLGFPRAEIFPKQDTLDMEKDGTQRLGNWLNLCYFDGDRTNRYMLDSDSRKMSLLQFLTLAESRRVDLSQIESQARDAHMDAPPCIQQMLLEGIPAGYRNEAMYNITLYMRKADPDEYLDAMMTINSKHFNPPMDPAEAKRTIRSAARREGYKYKCQQEPCKSRCDSAVCVTRKFGITRAERDDIDAISSMPVFESVLRFKAIPPQWGIHVDGDLVGPMITSDFMAYDRFRIHVMENTRDHRVLPMLTGKAWTTILAPLTSKAQEIAMPQDASPAGLTAARLMEFLDKAKVNIDDEKMEREKLLRGLPCLQTLNMAAKGDEPRHVKCLCFRGPDFVKYLRAMKSEMLRNNDLWFALKSQFTLDYTNLRVNKKVITVWYIPYDETTRDNMTLPDMTPEF